MSVINKTLAVTTLKALLQTDIHTFDKSTLLNFRAYMKIDIKHKFLSISSIFPAVSTMMGFVTLHIHVVKITCIILGIYLVII